MTPLQSRRLYFPAWGRAAKRRGWILHEGRLLADLDAPLWLPADHDLTTLLPVIHTRARELAAATRRAVLPDDLRHACGIIVTGKNLSSTRFTSEQTNRAVALFNLLSDPENMAFIAAWSDPDTAARASYIHTISTHATEAYTVKIARDKFSPRDFDGTFWQKLPTPFLYQLMLTIRKRQPTRRLAPPAPEPAPEMETAGQPF